MESAAPISGGNSGFKNRFMNKTARCFASVGGPYRTSSSFDSESEWPVKMSNKHNMLKINVDAMLDSTNIDAMVDSRPCAVRISSPVMKPALYSSESLELESTLMGSVATNAVDERLPPPGKCKS